MILSEEELIQLAEKTYPEFPTDAKLQTYNRDLLCHKKRKAFIKGYKIALEIKEIDAYLTCYCGSRIAQWRRWNGEKLASPMCESCFDNFIREEFE